MTLSMAMHQLLQFSFIMIENSAWFFGEFMFTNMLGPVFDKALNHYRYVFPIFSLLDGYHDMQPFTMDMRNTMDPFVEEHSITFGFFGELYKAGEGCPNYVPEANVFVLPQPES